MSHRPASLTEWRIFAKGRNGRWHMAGGAYVTKVEARANMNKFHLWGDLPTVVAPVQVEPCDCVDQTTWRVSREIRSPLDSGRRDERPCADVPEAPALRVEGSWVAAVGRLGATSPDGNEGARCADRGPVP